jgi:hypothetical protein
MALTIRVTRNTASDWPGYAASESTCTAWTCWSERCPTISGSQHRLQFHHIFPKALLRGSYTPREADDIANLAFIGGKTNRAISDKAPAAYLLPLVAQDGAAPFAAQCIPVEEELLALDHYKTFLQERRKRIAAVLNAFIHAAA